jgi:hypothetical protein
MGRETASKSYYLGERAIVVAGGLAGLSAARALSDRFRRIVILDRDQLPDGATPRPLTVAYPGVKTPGLVLKSLRGNNRETACFVLSQVKTRAQCPLALLSSTWQRYR